MIAIQNVFRYFVVNSTNREYKKYKVNSVHGPLCPNAKGDNKMALLISNEEYKNGLDALYELIPPRVKPLVSFLENKIFPIMKEKSTFLDIGAASGDLTKIIAPCFQSTTVVDEKHIFEYIYNKHGFDYYIGDFMNYNSKKKFDMILCSHVYYHVPIDQLEAFTKKMLSILKPNGILVVALTAPRGANHHLCLSLNKDYIHSEKIINILNKLNVSAEKESSTFKISTNDFQKIYAMCKLFISVDCFANSSDKLTEKQVETISKKINDYVLSTKQDNIYVYLYEEDYLVIRNS